MIGRNTVDSVLLQIDFLPADYRRQYTQQRLRLWRLAALLAAGVLVVAATAGQRLRRASLERQLAALAPQYAQAEKLNAQLAESQLALVRAEAQAALWTYLQHPWPRTQLLDALLRPLPDAVSFQSVTIGREGEPGGQPEAEMGDAFAPAATERSANTVPPAAEDLDELRRQFDRRPTTIILSGRAADSQSLYRYLDQLARDPLVAKIELQSIEAESAQRGASLRFSARILIRPGYGQPGGPQAESDQTRAPAPNADAEADNLARRRPDHPALAAKPRS
ncbi:MAG TPA: hypothetical protein EYP56_07110 [Planctomycetaceae bacterium]|nr:hypothetical protein [Planctomycetaceae bacterium]